MQSIRLDPSAYEEGGAFSLTIATARRRHVFARADVIAVALDALRETARRYKVAVYAYCFMPDHLHLLASAPAGTSLVNVVRHFKQLSSFRFRQLPDAQNETLWQRSFYDHALRMEEDLPAAAAYIWSNPIRAGLVSDPDQYPHAGSFEWDTQTLSGSEDPDLRRVSSAGRETNVVATGSRYSTGSPRSPT